MVLRRRQHVEYVDGETLVIDQPPYRAIFTAFFLFALGAALLTPGVLILTGHIDAEYWWPGEGWKTQAACFIGLGIVTFWPGSYVTYIAYHSYYGRQGFAFSQIPVHDD